MAASESALGKLHAALATVLTEALAGTQTESYLDPETGEEVPGTVIPPSAAVMTVAAKFLKDNDITCTVSDDNELGALQRQLAERQASLRRTKPLDAADLAGIAADTAAFAGRA